jgi:hypothetical protein
LPEYWCTGWTDLSSESEVMENFMSFSSDDLASLGCLS